MKLSIIYSMYNRRDLFARALKTVEKQTMPREDWELVVVDESTEDIKGLLDKYKGIFNIRYIRYDRKLHPIWQELNPNYAGSTYNEEHWYHTQAIKANIGIKQAQGDVVCIAQPEVLHSPHSFAEGYRRASEAKQIFGEVHWGTRKFNNWLSNPLNKWDELSFDELYEKAKFYRAEYEPNHMPEQGFYEMYWYVEYFPRAYALHIGGVDLAYQRGVYAEDDQFRARMRMAGCDDRWGGRPNFSGDVGNAIIGIHQSHMIEKEKYKNQDRDGQFWNVGASHNRSLWAMWHQHPYMVANEGLPYDIWGEFCITSNEYLPIGVPSE